MVFFFVIKYPSSLTVVLRSDFSCKQQPFVLFSIAARIFSLGIRVKDCYNSKAETLRYVCRVSNDIVDIVEHNISTIFPRTTSTDLSVQTIRAVYCLRYLNISYYKPPTSSKRNRYDVSTPTRTFLHVFFYPLAVLRLERKFLERRN